MADLIWAASRDVIEWAALECEHQRSGERSVLWMLDGWNYAMQFAGTDIRRKDIITLGQIVEPRKNDGSHYRRTNVRVGWNIKMEWEKVTRAMNNLVKAQGALEPDEWYYEYEEIHPFADGNGRTGNILWNWLRGTLESPTRPPDFWADLPEPDSLLLSQAEAILLRGYPPQ